MDLQQSRRINLVTYIKDHYKGNRAAFCRATGKNPNLINLVLTENEDYRRGFGEKLARDIEQRLGISRGWLDTPRGVGVKRVLTIPIVDYSQIPDVAPERYDYFMVLPTAYPRFSRVTATKNIVASVFEDAGMQPTIVPEDCLYIDLGIKSIEGDGLYIMRFSERTEVRRVQRIGSNIRLSKDDRMFEPVVLPEQQLFSVVPAVVGKVFCYARSQVV